MFIDRRLRSPRRGSEGRNETRLVLVTLISAPPNRAGGSRSFEYKHVTPTGLKPGYVPNPYHVIKFSTSMLPALVEIAACQLLYRNPAYLG